MDAMVISWLFDDRPNRLAERYRVLIAPRPVLLAFQTVMELAMEFCAPGGANCGADGLNGVSLS
jgi:hypothetical protein